MALCAGFVFFTLLTSVFSELKVRQEDRNDTHGLAFRAHDVDSSTLFTRQVADGETEGGDETLRHDSKHVTLAAQSHVALAHSIQLSTRTLLLAAEKVAVVRHLPIVYQRLLI